MPFPLAFDGALPYRDFYFPTLPGTIWLADLIMWLPIPPLFAWHVMSALIVAAVAPSAFVLLPKSFSLLARLFGSLVAQVLFLGLTIESIGGWNHLFLSFIWIGTALFVSSLVDDSTSRSLLVRIRPELSGFALTFAVFIKHSAAILVLFLSLAAVLYLVKRRTRIHLRSLLRMTMSSALLTVVLTSLAAIQGFLIHMVNGLGAAGKNPSIASYWRSMNSNIGEIGGNSTGLVIVLCLIVGSLSKYLPERYRSLAETLSVLVFFVVLTDVTLGAASWIALPAMVSVVFVFRNSSVKLTISLVVWLLLVLVTHSDDTRAIYESLGFTDKVLLFVVFASAIVVLSARTEVNVSDVVLVGLLLGTSMTTLVSGDLIISVVALPAVVLMFRVIEIHREILVSSLGQVLVVVLVVALAARLFGAYAQPLKWWGWNEPSLISARTLSTTPGVEWFWLGAETTHFYNSMQELFDEVEGASDQQLRIYQAPISPLLVTLSEQKPYVARCLVLWWDLCPEGEASQTAEILGKDPPEVLVWVRPSWSAVVAHESFFVRGESTFRRIDRWVEWMANTGRYREVGETMTVGNSVDTRWPVTVYQLRDKGVLDRLDSVHWGAFK